jgi:hypothetical protein
LIDNARQANVSSMQVKDAEELRRAWEDKGNPPCAHVRISKEYYLGADTGDYACVKCGATGVGRDWPKNERAALQARLEADLAKMNPEHIAATRALITMRRAHHVQRWLEATAADDKDEATKAATSRDACDTMLADLTRLEAELKR